MLFVSCVLHMYRVCIEEVIKVLISRDDRFLVSLDVPMENRRVESKIDVPLKLPLRVFSSPTVYRK